MDPDDAGEVLVEDVQVPRGFGGDRVPEIEVGERDGFVAHRPKHFHDCPGREPLLRVRDAIGEFVPGEVAVVVVGHCLPEVGIL